MSESKLVVNKTLTIKYDVDIGRPTKWGNRFIVGVDGPRGLCIRMFERSIQNNPVFREEIKKELSGKTLACYCASLKGLGVDDPLVCHGQIYLKTIRGDYDEQQA